MSSLIGSPIIGAGIGFYVGGPVGAVVGAGAGVMSHFMSPKRKVPYTVEGPEEFVIGFGGTLTAEWTAELRMSLVTVWNPLPAPSPPPRPSFSFLQPNPLADIALVVAPTIFLTAFAAFPSNTFVWLRKRNGTAACTEDIICIKKVTGSAPGQDTIPFKMTAKGTKGYFQGNHTNILPHGADEGQYQFEWRDVR
jgi:hypothetical protein